MYKMPSPHLQMESWDIFSISPLINFGKVSIWLIYQSLDKRIWFTVLFFSSQRELHSVWNSDFLGGTPTSIFHFFDPSAHPSVCCVPYLRNHTSSNHHLWYTCVKWWYLHAFFFIFLKFWFLGCYGGKRAKISPKWKNNYIGHTPYLRNSMAFNHNFWYTFVKWYLQVIFYFFTFFWSFHFSGC